jgi:hypothetical protein
MSIIKTEDPRYVRDLHSKALLSVDFTALQSHRRENEFFKKQMEDINILKTQVDSLNQVRDEIIEIKSLLRDLTKKEL